MLSLCRFSVSDAFDISIRCLISVELALLRLCLAYHLSLVGRLVLRLLVLAVVQAFQGIIMRSIEHAASDTAKIHLRRHAIVEQWWPVSKC